MEEKIKDYYDFHTENKNSFMNVIYGVYTFELKNTKEIYILFIQKALINIPREPYVLAMMDLKGSSLGR